MLTLMALMGLVIAPCGASEFEITGLKCEADEAYYHAEMEVLYRLSSEVREALSNGVPMRLDLELRLREENARWWEADRHRNRWSYRIHYHALASMFQVTEESSGRLHIFATLDGAVNALGKIRDLPIVPAELLVTGARYHAMFRAALDLDSLPLPLRPTAYLSPSWNLSSEWRSCLLAP